jgi:Fe-S cluster assembly ATP-binding protein
LVLFRYNVTKGSIYFDDKDVLAMTVDERSKAGMFLAMQYPLEISGVSNMDFLKSAINAHQDKPVSLYKFIKDFEMYSKEVGFNLDMASRHLNEGFSGGEKKRNEILQMRLLNPSLALIDEIDSGLDVDGLEMISKSINSMLDGEFSCLIISHYSKLYKLIKPTHVHIIVDGKIIVSGDEKLIDRVDEEGYKWIEKEFGVSVSKEVNKKVMLGTCNVKESVNHG